MISNTRLSSLLLAGVMVLSLSAFADNSASRYDAQIASKVTKQLSGDRKFSGVQTGVEDGIVTLRGAVPTYQDKLNAAKKIRKDEHVSGVRNLLQVSSTATDAQLQKAIGKRLSFDPSVNDNVFDAVTLGVNNGVVTIGGEVRIPSDRDYALSAVANTPGVKDVIDQIRVSPPSIMDDQLRVRLYRAIYGDPVLTKYAINPDKPIRIVVDNGRVALYGVVDSRMDKQVAGMRANQVFGAFSVTNNLQVPDRKST